MEDEIYDKQSWLKYRGKNATVRILRVSAPPPSLPFKPIVLDTKTQRLLNTRGLFLGTPGMGGN